MKKTDFNFDAKEAIDTANYKLSSASALLLPVIDYTDELLDLSDQGQSSLVVATAARNMQSISTLVAEINALIEDAREQLTYTGEK
ncbi:hypothetical protein [Lacticaseibacillus saniviri]